MNNIGYCYRHPSQQANIRCQRCDRLICNSCMNNAAVGFQCPECVHKGRKSTRQKQVIYKNSAYFGPQLTTMVLIGINVFVTLLINLTGRNSSAILKFMQLTPYGYGICYEVNAQGNKCLVGNLIPGALTGAPWQIITSAFTHVELLHLAFNMLALWFLGPELERIIGRAKFLAIYIISAVGGSALVIWCAAPTSSTVGASGAIFGLMGAILIVAHRSESDVRSVLMWLGLNLAFTFLASSNISWQGHIGGLISGILATAIVTFVPRRKKSLQLVGLILLTIIIFALIILKKFI